MRVAAGFVVFVLVIVLLDFDVARHHEDTAVHAHHVEP
jgi:hypothetical protein